MSALVESLLTAFALSGLAAIALASLPQAPPRLRFAIAAAGLAAWLVPWGAIHIVVPTLDVPAPLTATQSIAAFAASQLDVVTLLGYLFAGATAIGVLLFSAECLALRRCTQRWRSNSKPADGLRSLLPPELAAVAAEFRVVADSDVAAASGWLRPTIWIGDRFSGDRLRLVVIHEAWHAYDRDPLWIAAIAAIRRAYWWNPLVAHLARQAILMLESTCDHRSAAQFAKSRYVTELASLVLANATPAPGLLATVRTASLDVQRLKLLGAPLRVRTRDVAVVVALGIGAAATAMSNVVEAPPHPAPVSSFPQETAQTVTAQRSLLDVNGKGTELSDEWPDVYAYAPQQYLGEIDFDATRGGAQ